MWGSAITKGESESIERVQKIALKIIYKEKYISYQHALVMSSLPTLHQRRTKLSLRFALRCVNNSKTSNMFKLNPPQVTRNSEKFFVPHANSERYKHSAIPTMRRQLNEHFKK